MSPATRGRRALPGKVVVVHARSARRTVPDDHRGAEHTRVLDDREVLRRDPNRVHVRVVLVLVRPVEPARERVLASEGLHDAHAFEALLQRAEVGRDAVADLQVGLVGDAPEPAAGEVQALAPCEAARVAKLTSELFQLIDRAHARGLRIYGATLTPFQGAAYWTKEGEAKRQAVNEWIRTSKAYDGVIDFDAAVRDPTAPTQLRMEFNPGDNLHMNDAGYQAMANSIDLALFKRK